MGKEPSSKYKIDILSLEEKSHEYDFEANSTFFEKFENSPIEKGSWTGIVTLEKSSTMIRVHFELKAIIELKSDRSLKTFDYPLEIDEWITFKYGEEWAELDDDVWVIPNGLDRLNIAPFVFEFIVLGIPMKKLHPEEQEEDTEGMVFQSESDSEEDHIDPRWEQLKNLKK